jgi:hypothetical protein
MQLGTENWYSEDMGRRGGFHVNSTERSDMTVSMGEVTRESVQNEVDINQINPEEHYCVRGSQVKRNMESISDRGGRTTKRVSCSDSKPRESSEAISHTWV